VQKAFLPKSRKRRLLLRGPPGESQGKAVASGAPRISGGVEGNEQ
jgi:hypothetical protein